MDSIVRVYDIILDENHRCCATSTKEHCTPDDIGRIFYTPIDDPYPLADKNCELSTAQPYHYNISHYPVKNELVHIQEGPGPNHNELGPPVKYYLNPLSILQNVNSNAYPNKLHTKKDDYFRLNPFIKRLQPYEGDMIIQGRFGNSIRFGSTIDKTQIVKKNDWSDEGSIGSPITIISNGKPFIPPSVEEEYKHTVENINTDKSSIWLCSNQQITNLQIASLHDASYYYDRERDKEEEQLTISDEPMPEDVKEDATINTTEDLPADEAQETNELSDIQDDDTDYYDIAPTEGQSISLNDTITLPGSYEIPDTVNDVFLNEDIGSGYKRIHNISSNLASSNNIDNYPGKDEYWDSTLTSDFIWNNLSILHNKCITPLIEIFGDDIKIISAYRCIELNKHMGGTETSQHTKGYAIDLVSINHPSSVLFNWCKTNLPEWNQLIWEFPEKGDFISPLYAFSWIHISYIEGNNPKTCTLSSEVDYYHNHYEEEEIEPITRRGKYTHGITFADENLI